MRSPSRLRQKVWSSILREVEDGIDIIEKYDKPKEHNLVVSSTSGTPEEIAAGIVPTYDRYIVCYDRRGKGFRGEAVEGMALWIDRVPELDENGELVLKKNKSPVTPPDYRLDKIIDSQKSIVSRFGIVKIGASK